MADLAVDCSEWLRRQSVCSLLSGAAGLVMFTASADHATVVSYDVRVYPQGGGALVDHQNVGKPTPNGANDIVVDMRVLFSGIAAGNYEIKVAAIDGDGEAESTVSNAFALPLS